MDKARWRVSEESRGDNPKDMTTLCQEADLNDVAWAILAPLHRGRRPVVRFCPQYWIAAGTPARLIRSRR
jgi:hypothetical protein